MSQRSYIQRRTTDEPEQEIHQPTQPDQPALNTDPAALTHQPFTSEDQPHDAAPSTDTEAHAGHDFSQIRIFADDKASESPPPFNPQPTLNSHQIGHESGQYAQGTAEGQRFIANV